MKPSNLRTRKYMVAKSTVLIITAQPCSSGFRFGTRVSRTFLKVDKYCHFCQRLYFEVIS